MSSIVTAHDGKDNSHAAVQQLLSAVDGQIEFVRGHEMKAVHAFDQEIGETRTWSETEVVVVGIVITTVPIYVADQPKSTRRG